MKQAVRLYHCTPSLIHIIIIDVLTHPFIGGTSEYGIPESSRGVVNMSCSAGQSGYRCEYALSESNEGCLNHGSHAVITCFGSQ